MRLHEFTTRSRRLKHLKQVFDRIYGELAGSTRRTKRSTKRKPLPPAPREERTARSPLSARYPTLASTAQHMPQRIATKRRPKRGTVAPRTPTAAKPRRRAPLRLPVPTAAKPVSKPNPQKMGGAGTGATQASATKGASTGTDAVQAKQQGDRSTARMAALAPVPPSANTIKPVPAQRAGALTPAQRAAAPQRTPTQPAVPQAPARGAQPRDTLNAQAWRAANQPKKQPQLLQRT